MDENAPGYTLTGAKCNATHRVMIRGVRIALALLAVLAITVVLVTPDPSDDVLGIMNCSHPEQVQKLTVCSINPPAQQFLMSLLPAPPNSHHRLSSLELFDLACVYRC